METVVLPHIPQRPLHISVFSDVRNATFLRQRLLDGDSNFEYAFLDASVLLSKTHLLASCFRAINEALHNRLKTRNVHSEVVFSLSPNNNIAESFRRFGITDETRNLVAVKIGNVAANEGSDEASIAAHLQTHVQGTPQPFTDATLASMHDQARIRKVYRLNVQKKGDAPALLPGSEEEAFVLASIALKGT